MIFLCCCRSSTASRPAHSARARLAGSGAAAERDDADLGIEQQVDREALLGAAAVQAEHVAVAADQA